MLGPHAYVVDYRAVDACSPPACKIEGNNTFGRATDDPAGAYVTVGTDKDELFAKRGVVLAPAKELSFTLPRVAAGSLFDASLAAADGGAFRVALEVRAGGALLARREFEGTTAVFERHTEPAELGREEKYFSHVREPLPASDGPTVIILRNEGATRLGLGAPIVLRPVEGRKARQAIFVFFDAVPKPVFAELYRGAHPTTAWISGWVRRGVLFPEAVSPGQLTGSFVRRFFRADYYRLDGDPSLGGQGFDETPPDRAPGPIARLAEQGFWTEAIASNLYLSPLLSRVGFDSDYNIESTIDLQIHPQVLAARFAREMEVHGEDDAVFVIWFANTHAPWREGRADAPPLAMAGARSEELDFGVLDPIWKNLLDSVDALRQIVASADRHAAERIWVLGSDHGHTFTLASRARPWRLTHEAVADGHMHCCLATAQEAMTYLAVVEDEPGLPSGVVDEPLSMLAVWSELERRFGVKLDLPETSAFVVPKGHDQKRTDVDRFDDGILVSVGNSGALFGRHGDFSYHSYEPAPKLGPAWELGSTMSRLLFGSPEPAGGVLSEELYDLAGDPFEKNNLAERQFDDLLDMRRRMTDWLAEYGDRPERDRYRYHLDFAGAIELSVRAPRSFFLEGGTQPIEGAASANVSGASLRLRDGERPLGVVDLAGQAVDDKLLVRCASSGLPLAMLDRDHRRLNLALARTNCAGPFAPASRRPSPGEAFFYAGAVEGDTPSARAGVAVPELRKALMRWGYVRDK